MNRDFTNIKEIPIERLDENFNFCFTYNVQPNLYIEYLNNKGFITKRKYSTIPFQAQKAFLTKGMELLPSPVFFFEQCQDRRFHIHAFCNTTARNMLQYMKCRYEDCRMKDKTDIQDHCLLCEKVGLKPNWVSYCQKQQELGKSVFEKEITDFLNNVDNQFVKIEQNTYEQQEPDFTKYQFGKKFLIQI